jgi:3-dehydroquinate synthase
MEARLRNTGLAATTFVFDAGESSKTRETWADLTDRMLAAGIGRDGCVIAVGGGITGDLAGFVAATYMRGIPFVIVPTSLLAMIDASIGGKTAVDSAAGKNLVGAFHQPRLVVTDPALLESLPDEEFRSGLAEAVKHGVIADPAYLDWLAAETASILAREPASTQELIVRSIRIKADFVSADERETGRRAGLNFGHTLGHAIERLSGYRVPHGHAVSIGMALEARLGESVGITARDTARAVERVLEGFGLPVALPRGLEPADVARATGSDKKAVEGRTRYALVAAPGKLARMGGDWTHPVSFEAVVSSLQA